MSAGGAAEHHRTGSSSTPWLERLEVVEERLAAAADRIAPTGLTEADPASGEQWEAGQVWAHMAEFVPYWVAETRLVLDPESEGPVRFGRVKTDEGRIAAIEARRHDDVVALAAKAADDLEPLRQLLRQIDGDDDAWSRVGRHDKLGEMTLAAILEDFLVGHLEEHLDQLDDLDR